MKFATHLITGCSILLVAACAPLAQKEDAMEAETAAPVVEEVDATLVNLAPIADGETMIDIATEECRGQNWRVTMPMIQEASGLADVNTIYVGQVLKVWRDSEGRCINNPAMQ